MLLHLRLLLAFAALAPAALAAAPTLGGCPVLPADNIWNTRVDGLPVHARSGEYVASIGAASSFHMDFGSGLFDGGPIGIPFVTVPASQPRVPVTFDVADESDPGPYPIPPNAPIEGGSASDGDRHVLVVDQANCVLYELFYAFPVSGGARWDAYSGAVYDLNSNALRPRGWTSADAAGLPILPGLARYDEVAAGRIEHALRFTAPTTQRAFVWPARHFASSNTNPSLPPMGLRLRLKASVNIDGFSPQARVIARAMKEYGIMLADNGSRWFVSGAPDGRWNNDQLRELRNLRGEHFEAVDVSGLMVDPDSGVAGAPTTVRLAAAPAIGSAGQPLDFTMTVTSPAGVPTAGSIGIARLDSLGTTDPIPGCSLVPIPASGTFICSVPAGFAAGIHDLRAVYFGSPGFQFGSASLRLAVRGSALFASSPASLGFGAQSMNTTSPPQTVSLLNTTGATATMTAVTPSPGFVVVSDTCSAAPVAAGSTCALGLVFTPTGVGTVDGFVALQYPEGPTVIPLAGSGERSLVTHYYNSILRRPPDGSGKPFWESEAERLSVLGANVNETWYSMATFFYFSPEYLALGRDNTGFVTDLYNTFFNRAPDGGGLGFWTGQIASGMPREVVLVGFMLSPEFVAFTQNIFGSTAARAEVNVVMDFYRGLLSRLPDNAGFAYWVGQFRAAQCNSAGAVYAQVESISRAFATSAEYIGRNRTTGQYVGDLYNAFLRRGGDLGGVQFWIGQLTDGRRSREQVRQAFISTQEFSQRVQAVVNQGCIN